MLTSADFISAFDAAMMRFDMALDTVGDAYGAIDGDDCTFALPPPSTSPPSAARSATLPMTTIVSPGRPAHTRSCRIAYGGAISTYSTDSANVGCDLLSIVAVARPLVESGRRQRREPHALQAEVPRRARRDETSSCVRAMDAARRSDVVRVAAARAMLDEGAGEGGEEEEDEMEMGSMGTNRRRERT